MSSLPAPDINFPRFQEWNAFFYLNDRNRVNTILTHFLRLPTPRGIGRRETIAERDMAACTRSGAKSVRDRSSSPVADRENLGSGERCYGLGGGVGRGLGPGEDLGVGVGLGVGVAVVEAVALAVAVAVAVA